MKNYSLPYWNELPDLDLYLDQVLFYVNKATQTNNDPNWKKLTPAMINNYVKHKQIDKPVKKKYKRQQLARLIVITVLKAVFSIQEISQALELLLKEYESENLYNYFVECMHDKTTTETPTIVYYACQSIKLHHQTRQLFLELESSHHEQ